MGSPVRFKFGAVALFFQAAFIILFAFLVEYDWRAHPIYSDPNHAKYTNETKNFFADNPEETSSFVGRKYPPFQDVHVMIFVGFGFLMTFLRRYGFTSVSINMFLASLLIQWAMIVRGCIHEGIFVGDKYQVRVEEMVSADFATATILISFGAVLGRTSPVQLLIMGIIEVIVAQINSYICHDLLHAVDIGESMYIHAFGAYFGLAVSRVLYNENAQGHPKAGSCYHSDLFSMIGTIFLWLYWPSFNGGGADGDEQHRAYINTYLSLCACTVVTFAFTALYKKGRFSMEFIQNATLAGGVAVGTTAHMPLQPFGAILMGTVAGFISCTGFHIITEKMAEKLKIQDTCGVHNLHGMPAVLAATAGAVMGGLATEEDWGRSVYEIFPTMIPENPTDEFKMKFPGLDYEGGKGYSGKKQGGFQFLALVVTLGIAIVSGVITGFIMKIPILDQVHDEDELFEDTMFFNVPDSEDRPEGSTVANKYLNDNNGTQMTPMGEDNRGRKMNEHL